MSLQRFFGYFGGKHQSARYYPAPRYPTIIEPFAGGAGYSCAHYRRRIILIEKDPEVAALWSWLRKVGVGEILTLPLLAKGEQVRELNVSDDARSLIGRNVNPGAASPRQSLSTWAGEKKGTWGAILRARIAMQVERIRHWKIIEGDYTLAPDIEATWFIDPPYQGALGGAYRHGSSRIDFRRLGDWCRSRKGQVIVCEAHGADWLPFRPLRALRPLPRQERVRGPQAMRREILWTND